MKQQLRNQLLAQRRNLSPELRATYDTALCENVLAWWETQQVSQLGVYWPIRGEPDLQIAYAELTRRGVQLALPIVVAPDTPLQFAKWAPGDALITGAMNVPVPAAPPVFIQPEALLIPCVGFNSQGARLGYGGGFYDRTLASKPHPIAIGIAYQCVFADFPADEHDIPLDAILTEI